MSTPSITRRSDASALLGGIFAVGALTAEFVFDAEGVYAALMFLAAFEFGYAFACLDAMREEREGRR